ADLAILVRTPAPQGSIGLHRAAEESSGRNGRDARPERDDLDRRELLGGRPIAELTGRVLPPAPQRTVGLHGAAMDASQAAGANATHRPAAGHAGAARCLGSSRSARTASSARTTGTGRGATRDLGGAAARVGIRIAIVTAGAGPSCHAGRDDR